MLYLVWFMVFNATFNNISVILYYVRFQKNIKHFFFISVQVWTQKCAVQKEVWMSIFHIINFKKKKDSCTEGSWIFLIKY